MSVTRIRVPDTGRRVTEAEGEFKNGEKVRHIPSGNIGIIQGAPVVGAPVIQLGPHTLGLDYGIALDEGGALAGVKRKDIERIES